LGLITRDKSSFEWTELYQREFDDIKEALMSDPVMAYPDWNKQFILTTDASYSGLGAVLSQQFPEGERVIAYASKRLQRSENNYPITQLEALAVVWAMELFRDPYLANKQFKLFTDYRALLKFQNMQTESNRTLQLWSMKLSEYDMEIEYKPGKDLVNVDCLSRSLIEEILGIEKVWNPVEFGTTQQKDPY
jgi:hypothetical protein